MRKYPVEGLRNNHHSFGQRIVHALLPTIFALARSGLLVFSGGHGRDFGVLVIALNSLKRGDFNLNKSPSKTYAL